MVSLRFLVVISASFTPTSHSMKEIVSRNTVEDPNYRDECGFMDASLYNICCPSLDFSHEEQKFPSILLK